MNSSTDVEELASGLLSPRRDRPWAVVSIPVAGVSPLVDVDQLAKEAGDVCRLFVIPTGTLTRELDELLPDRCQVYGGAARVYPTGTTWQQAPEESPLRIVHNPWDTADVTDKLIADALGMAHTAGLFTKPAPSSVPASGQVRSLLAGGKRAFVQLDSGGFATIVHELTFPQIPLDWVICEGQGVTGLYDPETKRLALDVVRVEPKELLKHYPDGAVTLAFVVSVERQRGVLAVHPSLPITVTRAQVSTNPLDRVDLLLAAGDVVRVRVVRDAQGRTALQMSDVDDDEEICTPLALIPGGEPWLVEDRHKPEIVPKKSPSPERDEESAHRANSDDVSLERDDSAVPLRDTEILPSDSTGNAPPSASARRPAPRPAPGIHLIKTAVVCDPESEDDSVFNAESANEPVEGLADTPTEPASRHKSSALLTTQLALQQERERTKRLEEQLQQIGSESAIEQASILRFELRELHAENIRQQEQLVRLKADQQTQRALLRRARQTLSEPRPEQRRERFDTVDEWIRHEIYLAWIGRMDASDRATWPLPASYSVGEQFAPSFEQHDNSSREKTLKAVVDVLTGRARELPARALHPLRSGDGATAGDVVRPDGARCMRVHIEKNVASARRLHFWHCDDGEIELSRVVVHDDMEP
ncbi:hypothetical protein [Salinibacterium sp. SWN1162]|uniref:hypothetical protein n=1 Tax=Salinibacterium sp. SWN1162 TaxID=2792053 RepID=UPI0018CC926A|nr:hypothetical protein [Salinibacterium sp. SWN1162]MBH0007914.1 hypothetical protein [Salinibacterium sp. SWN1162]